MPRTLKNSNLFASFIALSIIKVESFAVKSSLALAGKLWPSSIMIMAVSSFLLVLEKKLSLMLGLKMQL